MGVWCPLVAPGQVVTFVSFVLLAAECKAEVYVPYAKHMLSQDKFDDARLAYVQAGLPAQGTKILEQLAANAVTENRFSDAAYYFFSLAMDTLKVSVHSPFIVSEAQQDQYACVSGSQQFMCVIGPVHGSVGDTWHGITLALVDA